MYITRVRFRMKSFFAPKSSLQPNSIQAPNYCSVKMQLYLQNEVGERGANDDMYFAVFQCTHNKVESTLSWSRNSHVNARQRCLWEYIADFYIARDWSEVCQRRTKFSNTAAIGGESVTATSGSSNSTGKQGKEKGWRWNCAAALCTNNWRNKDSAYYTLSKIGLSTDAALYMTVLKNDDIHWNKAVIFSQHWSKDNVGNLVYDLPDPCM